jgi:hypothetical protein
MNSNKQFISIGELCLNNVDSIISPIYGWLLSKNKTIENYYIFCPNSDPLGRLLHYMYYRDKGLEFAPTVKKNNIITYLDSFCIGVITSELNCCLSRKKDFNKKNVIDIILNYEPLSKRVKEQEEKYQYLCNMIKEINTYFQSVKDDIEKLHNEGKEISKNIESYTSILARLKSNILHEYTSESTEYVFKTLDERIRKLKSKKKEISRSYSKQKRQKIIQYNRRIEDLIFQIRDRKQIRFLEILSKANKSIREEYFNIINEIEILRNKKSEIPNSVHKIRQSSLFEIKKHITSLGLDISFFESNIPIEKVGRYLDTYLNTFLQTENPNDVLLKSLQHIISIIEDINKNIYAYPNEILLGPFMLLLNFKCNSINDTINYFEGINKINPQILFNEQFQDLKSKKNLFPQSNFEKFCFAYYINSMQQSPIPPIAFTRYVNYSYKGKDIKYPDCGETAVRNTLNLFLYNRQAQNYNFEILEKCKYNVKKEIIAYYKKYSCVEDTTRQESHNDWARIIENINTDLSNENQVLFIEPKISPIVEMKAGASNFARAFCALFNHDNLNDILHELNELQIIKIGIDYCQFDLSEDDKSENGNKLVFNFDLVKVEIICNYRHFRVYIKNKNHDELSLSRSLMELSNIYGTYNAILSTSIELKKYSINEFHISSFVKSLSDAYLLFFILSTRTDWVSDFVSIVWYIIKNDTLCKTNNANYIIENIILSIPKINNYQIERYEIAEYLKNNNNSFSKELVYQLLN